MLLSATERAKLQERLDSLSTTQTSSSVEVQTLRQRVEETEREKRDLMGVVSRLQEDATQRDSEIQTLRIDLKTARQDHQSLERKVRELTSSETSTKVCFSLCPCHSSSLGVCQPCKLSFQELATRGYGYVRHQNCRVGHRVNRHSSAAFLTVRALFVDEVSGSCRSSNHSSHSPVSSLMKDVLITPAVQARIAYATAGTG